MATLSIDTSQREKVVASLTVQQGKKEKIGDARSKRAQIVLAVIDELLQEEGLRVTDLTAIEVMTGPGSYTGLRVGVSVALTLSWFLGLPLNGAPPGTVPTLKYEGDRFLLA